MFFMKLRLTTSTRNDKDASAGAGVAPRRDERLVTLRDATIARLDKQEETAILVAQFVK